MANSDEAMYTGVDNDGSDKGVFGNEAKDKKLKDKIREQDSVRKELFPVLNNLLKRVDNEIKLVTSIDRFENATKDPEINIRAELQAAALYKKYLIELKTGFTLDLRKIKKGK